MDCQATANAPHIIALTADASAKDREKCFAAGMRAFLTKPLRITELATALREAFAAQNHSGEEPADYESA